MYINGIRYYESEEPWKAELMGYDDAVEVMSHKGLTRVKCSVRRGYMKKGRG